MPLYDYLAPGYDLAFERIYRPFRVRALRHLQVAPGACVLDLACGTGQNFPLLAQRLGPRGHIIGLDLSGGMLRYARRRLTAAEGPRVTLIQADAAKLTPALLEARAGLARADAVVCSFGLTAMREGEAAFRASWSVLAPGGSYLLHDIDAALGTWHVRAVEFATRCHFTQRVWRPLRDVSAGFQMEYLDPSAYLFGGRVFAARGTKPERGPAGEITGEKTQ